MNNILWENIMMDNEQAMISALHNNLKLYLTYIYREA